MKPVRNKRRDCDVSPQCEQTMGMRSTMSSGASVRVWVLGEGPTTAITLENCGCL